MGMGLRIMKTLIRFSLEALTYQCVRFEHETPAQAAARCLKRRLRLSNVQLRPNADADGAYRLSAYDLKKEVFVEGLVRIEAST
jgi:hypothetical protein